MNYYNEIFFVLFGFIFLILAISSAPYYRSDAIERQSLLLAGIPLAGAVSFFHFLTEPSARRAYVELVRRSVKPGAYVLMATFGPDGPLQCSGLDVVRYDDQSLHHEFGEGFQMIGSELAEHNTPMGTHQQFLYCWCRA